jgi:hypothetical protein
MITAVTRAAAARRRRARADAIAPWMTYALVGVAAVAGGRAVDLALPGIAAWLSRAGSVRDDLDATVRGIAWAGGHALRRTAGRRRRLLMAPWE